MIKNNDGTVTMTAEELRVCLYDRVNMCVLDITKGKETINLESTSILLETDEYTAHSQSGTIENALAAQTKALMRSVQQRTTINFDQFVEMLREGWIIAQEEIKEECQRGNADTLH